MTMSKHGLVFFAKMKDRDGLEKNNRKKIIIEMCELFVPFLSSAHRFGKKNGGVMDLVLVTALGVYAIGLCFAVLKGRLTLPDYH